MWNYPPSDLGLEDEEVHVWLANLDLSKEEVYGLEETLSRDERERANRFHFPQHRERFIVGRGTLRTILGRYLAIKPQVLQFEYSSRGKPKLADSCNSNKLQFNLSHSQGLALYVFSRDRLVGIDVEYLRPMADAERIAQRFFSPQEYTTIKELPAREKERAFFRGWTGKEAYLKAIGHGLAGSLASIEVNLKLEEPTGLLSIGSDFQAAAHWSLLNLPVPPEYIASLAVQGASWQLSCLLFVVSC